MFMPVVFLESGTEVCNESSSYPYVRKAAPVLYVENSLGSPRTFGADLRTPR